MNRTPTRATTPSRQGYKVIHRTNVHEVLTLEAAAEAIASFYPDPSRVSVRETLTADRPVNAEETLALADLTAAILLNHNQEVPK